MWKVVESFWTAEEEVEGFSMVEEEVEPRREEAASFPVEAVEQNRWVEAEAEVRILQSIETQSFEKLITVDENSRRMK